MPVYGVHTERIPGLAGVSSPVDTVGNAHTPRCQLIPLLATGSQGGRNYSQCTWRWLILHSSYLLHSLANSFSFLHSDYPEFLILQLTNHICAICQIANCIDSGSTGPPVASIFPQFHVTISFPVTAHGIQSSIKPRLKDNHLTNQAPAWLGFCLFHLRHRTINVPAWICILITTREE